MFTSPSGSTWKIQSLRCPKSPRVAEESQRGWPCKCASLGVEEWVNGQPAETWQEIRVRPSCRGELRVEALHRRVWLWDNREPQARCWHLLVARESASPDCKIHLEQCPSRNLSASA